MLGNEIAEFVNVAESLDLREHKDFIASKQEMICKAIKNQFDNNRFECNLLEYLIKLNLNAQVISLISIMLHHHSIHVKIKGVLLCIRVRKQSLDYDALFYNIIKEFLYYRDIELLEPSLEYLCELQEQWDMLMPILMKQFVYTIDLPISRLFTRCIIDLGDKIGVYIFKHVQGLFELCMDSLDQIDPELTLLTLQLIRLLDNKCFVTFNRFYPQLLARLAERFRYEKDASVLAELKAVAQLIKDDPKIESDIAALASHPTFKNLIY
jgi:hypothetical protein